MVWRKRSKKRRSIKKRDDKLAGMLDTPYNVKGEQNDTAGIENNKDNYHVRTWPILFSFFLRIY